MYIAKDYDMQLEAPACEPGAEYWNATARFQNDISEVFPYLNAQWKNAIYSPAAKQLTYQMKDRAVALKSHEVTISNLPSSIPVGHSSQSTVQSIGKCSCDPASCLNIRIGGI